MLQTVKLGGVERPILFGQTVYKLYREQTGKNFAELLLSMESGDTSALPDLVYWALRTGELAQKASPGQYTETDVSLWLDQDQDAFEKCIAAYFDSIIVAKNVLEAQAKRITGNGQMPGAEKKMKAAMQGDGT